MANRTSMPAAEAAALDDPVRHGLADPEVLRRLKMLIGSALGRLSAGLTFKQRAEEAEEILQEVSKQAIASADRFKPERSLVNWLGGIVWNLAKQRRRNRLAAIAAMQPEVFEETVPDSQISVPDSVASRIDSQEILKDLLPADARLLTLYSEGWTAQEIGENLKLTPGNVRVRLSRLIKRVRGKYQNAKLEANHD